MTEILNIFENTAFPIAVCVVLFYVVTVFVKAERKQNDEASAHITAANEEFKLYLKEHANKQTQIILENTKAFNALIKCLDEIKETIKQKYHDCRS